MDAISIITYGALFLFLLQLFQHFFISSNGSKKLPPSPPSLPIIGHLHHLKKPLHLFLARLAAQHGPILLLRFGIRPVLVVSSAALAEECLTTNDITFANRPRLPSLKLTSYNYTNLPTANYGPGWREMRRIATIEALSGHRLAFFADVRAEEARDLARRLFRETAVGGFTRVELRLRLYGLAMNVMTRVMVGKRCYGEEDGDEEARRFKKMVEEALADAGASNVGDFLPTAIGWFLRRNVEKKLARIHSYRDQFLQGLVDERRRKRRAKEEEGRSAPKTMLDSILSMQRDDPEQYSDTYIKSLFVPLLAAGTDTSSNTIEWAMSRLLNNPDKLSTAREEIDEKVGHDRLFEESDLPNLSYLHCIINETFRLCPVVPLLLPHHCLEPCKVGGYDIPSGTMLMVNAYVIQRDPRIWSKPTEFIPERFRDAEAEGGMLLPFGMGRRRCPGEGLALKELGLVLGTLIQCFEWRRIGPEEVDLKEGSGITMPKANPLEALCMPRQVMPLLAAGTDTSSNTIEWAMSRLLNNPDKLSTAREEIDEKVGHDRLFEESDLPNLSYLHCIINETFRLCPVVPLLLPHHCLEPCKVGGYDIPSGTMLMVNAYVIQRDPRIWSKPTEFIPERFRDAEAEGGMLLPFGMGRRRCPGEGLALKELGLVLGTLIQCFEWRRIGPEEVDLKEGSGITMPKANPLEALCMPRQVMVKALSQLK